MAELTRSKAIRAKCLDCCCGDAKEVRLCNINTCSLHPYRMGNKKKAEILDISLKYPEKLNENDT